jgi:hypothetical protein
MRTLILTIFVSLIYFSCSNNACDDLDCGLNGTCNETTESCDCNEFYEGQNCEDEVRSKYLGSWSGTGLCDYNPSQ